MLKFTRNHRSLTTIKPLCIHHTQAFCRYLYHVSITSAILMLIQLHVLQQTA